jgi:DNA-binding response OmpR family regulator
MTTILLVEDEESLRILYEDELTRDGYCVLCAANGKDAVHMARSAQPDVIVMDINLPENIDGLEAMSRILAENKGTPVIINTGYRQYQDNFMSWAAEAYVLKSADLGPLKEAIQDVLARKHADSVKDDRYGAAGPTA